MRFRNKPAIVNQEWFIDSLESLKIQSTTQYAIDTSSLFTQTSSAANGHGTSRHQQMQH